MGNVSSHRDSATPNTIVHHGLDELIPASLYGKSGQELLTALKTNNLANKILDVYYRIKRNVEYTAQGKESLYSIAPGYSTHYPRALLNARHSRHYFYLIAHHPDISFGYYANLAAHVVQNNKIRLEQNTKALQGYKIL
jgi:hypothetical protein|tara:strand:+ start:702 stop:1118 length:417 start_codon:yes stop_codon:yes gene_type:complete